MGAAKVTDAATAGKIKKTKDTKESYKPPLSEIKNSVGGRSIQIAREAYELDRRDAVAETFAYPNADTLANPEAEADPYADLYEEGYQ